MDLNKCFETIDIENLNGYREWYGRLKSYVEDLEKNLNLLKKEIIEKDSLKEFEDKNKIKAFLELLFNHKYIDIAGSIGQQVSSNIKYKKKVSELNNKELEELYKIIRKIILLLYDNQPFNEHKIEKIQKLYEKIANELKFLDKRKNQNRFWTLSLRLIAVLDNFKHFSSIYSKGDLKNLNKCFELNVENNPMIINMKIREIIENRVPKEDKVKKFILPWILYETCCKEENEDKENKQNIEKDAKINCKSDLKINEYIRFSFYNSLKTKGFVILAGLSGTGKTKIFEEFVKCFPTLDKGEKGKWIVIKETGKKLLPVKKEEIEFKRGKISITNFIESINEALSSESNRKVFLKLNNYYVDLIPVIGKLKEKTNLITSSDITNHLSVYIASLFGFEIIEKEDIEKLNLQKLDKELEIREFERKISNNLFFPIRPDFKDTKSLLGFYNPLKEKYHSTPLLDFVLDAVNNYLEKGNEADPFFVLFDEMNLARVEYYFADFLSVLEAKRFENSNETIENENFIEFLKALGKETSVINENNCKFTSQSIKLHNEEKIDDIPKELFLPPNLYFVGTVNIDETTHIFSPKVLDRAFTIEFDVGSFNDYLEFLNKNSDNSSLDDEFKDKLKEDFINDGGFAIIYKEKIKDFAEKNKNIVKKLQDINEVLRKYNLHFGYRVFDEIMMFLYNSQNSQYSFESLDEAFDLAIKMKVLPKFHGTRQKLEEPIIEFLKELKLADEKSKENEDNQPNPKEKDLMDEILENLKEIPVIENKTLKVSLGEKEFRIQTPYLNTTHKLLEILYKLKTQGFASFM